MKKCFLCSDDLKGAQRKFTKFKSKSIILQKISLQIKATAASTLKTSLGKRQSQTTRGTLSYSSYYHLFSMPPNLFRHIVDFFFLKWSANRVFWLIYWTRETGLKHFPNLYVVSMVQCILDHFVFTVSCKVDILMPIFQMQRPRMSDVTCYITLLKWLI